MKLIIDIDEETFNKLPEAELGSNVIEDVLEAVEDGIPLDDLRTEIEQMNNIDYVEPVSVDEILQIIDRYRNEVSS